MAAEQNIDRKVAGWLAGRVGAWVCRRRRCLLRIHLKRIRASVEETPEEGTKALSLSLSKAFPRGGAEAAACGNFPVHFRDR